MICVSDILSAINDEMPFALQEDYDNSGLIIGDITQQINSALLCVDVTETVIDEAIKKNIPLIISHHPFIFSGIRRLHLDNPIGRIIKKAMVNNISIIASHTNTDNAKNSVSRVLASKLGLINTQVLVPMDKKWTKLVVFCPVNYTENVRNAIFEAGAGHIGAYDSCSFNVDGFGTFRAGVDSNPFVGKVGSLHSEAETRIETIVPIYLVSRVIDAMKKAHPYEEVAYDLYSIDNKSNEVGSGAIGTFPEPISDSEFLSLVSDKLGVKQLRHSPCRYKNISRVALCGGSGASFISHAIKSGAEAYITADIKYHQFFDAEDKILLVDAGHYETEQFVQEIISDLIIKKFPKFATHFTETYTNPITYYSK